MKNLLYIAAILLIIGWFLGVFAWDAGGLIHILFIIAIIAVLLGLIQRA